MKQPRVFLLAALTVLWMSPAAAATLSLVPGAATVAPGGTVALDLVVGGLGDMSAPALGDFDIDLAYDTTALTVIAYGLGTELGDLAALEALDLSFGDFFPGVFNLAEVSLLTPGELDAAQPDAFVLATIEFMATGLAPGASTFVDIGAVFALGDATGSPLALDGVSGATITAGAVPLPGAVWLLAAALLTLGGHRRMP